MTQASVSSYQEFLHCVGSGPLVQKATGFQLISDWVAAMLSHTWFVVPQGTKIMAPSIGSRPGDPNADVLFFFVLSKLLQEIRQRASDEVTEDSSLGPVNRHLSWVDDLTFAATSGSKSEPFAHLSDRHCHCPCVAAVIWARQDCCDVGIQGRQKVDQDLRHKLPLMTEHWGLIEVPVVTHHKHLAGHILRGGAKLQEIKIHAAMTLQNLKPLKRILSDKNIDLQKRQ